MTAKKVTAHVVLTVRVLFRLRRYPLTPKLGTYDSCFYVGKYAAALCPGRKLGPWPAGRTCPSYLYPSPFDKND
jgi:hypothetical protein